MQYLERSAQNGAMPRVSSHVCRNLATASTTSSGSSTSLTWAARGMSTSGHAVGMESTTCRDRM